MSLFVDFLLATVANPLWRLHSEGVTIDRSLRSIQRQWE
jgi:hypothetical protein